MLLVESANLAPPAPPAPQPAAAAANPLPWRWFEFREPAVDARREVVAACAGEPLEKAAQRVWRVLVDGQDIPFKYLRKPPDGGAARPVLLMLHGMGLTIASFHGVAGYLLETHDLILPDYSGFSRQALPLPGHASMQEFAALVWRVADAAGVEKLSLAGSSLGGGLCITAALLAPQRVERMVLSNPACFPQSLPKMYRLAKIPLVGELLMAITPAEKFIGGLEYIGYVDKNRFDPVLRAHYVSSLASARTRFRLMQIIRQLPANECDLTSARHLQRLKELNIPVLITWGVQDKLLVPGAGRRLADALPSAEYWEHEDLAHMPHEEAPERLGPRWAAFLNAGTGQ
jgi:pimeloyl-ACP methyl ester carboxylesterase